MTRLQRLYAEQGQSPWLDELGQEPWRRGQLGRWVELGVRGVSSSPRGLQALREPGPEGQRLLQDLALAHPDPADAYWALALEAALQALEELRPLQREGGDGDDGFVSLATPPRLAHDAEAAADAVRWLARLLPDRHLLAQLPATRAGLQALTALVAEGHSLDATLVFSEARGEEVALAYLAGLEAHPGDLSTIHGLASLPLAPLDAEVDRRLVRSGGRRARALQGRAGVALAREAHRRVGRCFEGPRWEALARRGAHPLRLAWVETAPPGWDYAPTHYVDALIGPGTVCAMSAATLEAFETRGRLQPTLELETTADLAERLGAVGVSLEALGDVLQDQALSQATGDFAELMLGLRDRAALLAQAGGEQRPPG